MCIADNISLLNEKIIQQKREVAGHCGGIPRCSARTARETERRGSGGLRFRIV